MLLVRRFREDDAEGLSRLTALLGEDSLLPVPLEQRLRRPSYSPEQDLFLAEYDGRIVAYLDTFREPRLGRVIFEGAVLPGYRRWVAPELLRRGVEHAVALGATAVHFPVAAGDRTGRRLLKEQGFTPVRRFLRLVLRSVKVPAAPPWPLLRTMEQGEEARLAYIQNLSFSGSWGFQPNTEEDIRYSLSLACCRREGVFFALIADKVVGYCWTRELGSKGEIWMLGVDPAWQGRGVGRALLLQGIHHLRRRGFRHIRLTVDAENARALALYRSVGFRRAGAIVWYERRL